MHIRYHFLTPHHYKTPSYKWIRTAGAVSAGIASVAWIFERSPGKINLITGFVEAFTQYATWFIVTLAIVSIIIYIFFRTKKNRICILSLVPTILQYLKFQLRVLIDRHSWVECKVVSQYPCLLLRFQMLHSLVRRDYYCRRNQILFDRQCK